MRRLDQRGAAAFEFCLVAVFFFTFVFAIFDLGRYAITMQLLRALASEGARATMIQCYTPQVTQNASPSSCTDVNTYYSNTYLTSLTNIMGLTPTLSASTDGSVLTITASLPGFSMMTPIWSALSTTPNASTSIPY
ncbi:MULTISPECIES: TadE/TadG family type IV pilus assembly protein [unclassified Bradyrhizobium]|uniref:TadE/TadG family type IV pilus assembly protein n=1 Tax=unclassified Bradyrhizobium TaxID=2631580 RepID=UPI001FED2EE2|nr:MULTISPECIES: TadE/TadG family type IV pilus assembly protein [unclassified Bradyrhizobium]